MSDQVPQMFGGKALILSDDEDAGRVLGYALERRGVETRGIEFGPTSDLPTDLNAYDLIVIDHNRTETDVLSLCRTVRERFAQPLLLFTYETDERYHLKAYETGIEECVVNPIGISLFLAKALAWLRRAAMQKSVASGMNVSESQVLSASNLQLDLDHRTVTTPEGTTVRLSNLECRLLNLFMVNRGQVLERELLVRRIWSEDEDPDERLLKNLIYRLRRKIEPDPRHPQYIQTVADVGYTLRVHE